MSCNFVLEEPNRNGEPLHLEMHIYVVSFSGVTNLKVASSLLIR